VDETAPYVVVILLEEGLTSGDASQIRSLHEGIEDPLRYHVLLPLDDAPARLQAALGSVGATADLGPIPMPEIDTAGLLEHVRAQAAAALEDTLTALRATGAEAQGTLVSKDPIEALSQAISDLDGREAIIVTQPHVVAEFFHLDWTSKARRRLGVPVLHLLEHETFDEQAGGGEGVTGL
jgi:hypothetical protein